MTESTWDERAQLGEVLARDLTGAMIDERVIALLLDAADTGVTSRTAFALLARQDTIGLRHVLRASAKADSSQVDWFYDEYRSAANRSDGEGFLRPALHQIAAGDNVAEAAEAVEVLTWLGWG